MVRTCLLLLLSVTPIASVLVAQDTAARSSANLVRSAAVSARIMRAKRWSSAPTPMPLRYPVRRAPKQLV